jgi:ribosomal protein L40E
LHALFSKPKHAKQKEFNSKICPSCLKTFSDETKECAKCKINLEPIKGFLEKHPYTDKRVGS